MKKTVIALAALCLLTAAAAEPVTIGVLSPLTGGAAGTGQAQRAGFELALKEMGIRIIWLVCES